jgi:hypothetical protein
MKTYGGVEVLISAIVGGEWSASNPGHFTSGEIESGTYCIGGWVGCRVDLDAVEKRKILPMPGIEQDRPHID